MLVLIIPKFVILANCQSLFENKIQKFSTKLNQVNDFRSAILCTIWRKYYVFRYILLQNGHKLYMSRYIL